MCRDPKVGKNNPRTESRLQCGVPGHQWQKMKLEK